MTELAGDNMASALAEIFLSGGPLSADLLLSVPTSSDPSTWQRPKYDGYQPAIATVTVVNSDLPGGFQWRAEFIFSVQTGIWFIAAWGLTYQGSVVAVATVAQQIAVSPPLPVKVVITGIFNPVIM